MTQAQTKFSQKFWSLVKSSDTPFWSIRVIYRIRGWFYELQNVFLKNRQTSRIAKVNI